MAVAPSLTITGVPGLPEVAAGTDLADLITTALRGLPYLLQADDVVVVAQKVVSKAEGRSVAPVGVEPSPFARTVAAATGKQPELVEVILRQSRRVVRMQRHVLLVETHQGLVCANAGVDQSNVPGGRYLLLPVDPDASAARLRQRLIDIWGVRLAVIVADTFGRPWRIGQTNVAIGAAGLLPLLDYRGQRDAHGMELQATAIAVADELAAAAELVMGKSDGVPVAIVRGARYQPGSGRAADLVRPAEQDLFR